MTSSTSAKISLSDPGVTAELVLVLGKGLSCGGVATGVPVGLEVGLWVGLAVGLIVGFTVGVGVLEGAGVLGVEEEHTTSAILASSLSSPFLLE